MHLGSRVPESDVAHYTPRALLFEALKQRTCSGENFHSLLNESRIHKGLASGDANQTLEEVDGKSPQSSFQISLPLSHNASPEENGGTKRVNISGQSQFSFLSDDYKETSVNVQQMPKSLLFDQLKRMPAALQPVRVADKLSDAQAAKTVSQSFDSSGILAELSIRSTLKQTESTKTLSDAEMPELLNSSNSKQAECIKHTPEKLTIRHKGSGLKRKTCTTNPVVRLSRISQKKDSIESHDNDLADNSHEEKQFHTCSPFKSSNSQQVLDESKDCCPPVLVRSTLVSASSVSQGHALNKTNNNRETRCSSAGISMPNLLPSTEFLSPQNVASESESHSANDRLFNLKTVRNVRHAAPSSVGKEVSSSGEDVQSSSDEVFESRPTSVERPSSMNQSGETRDDQRLSKPSKRRSLHLRKQDCRSLSSKGDAAVITENHLSSTGSELEGGHQNVVELDKWTLRLVSDQRLSLAGYKKDEPGGRLHCSDPVTRRLRKDMVQTTSGMIYHLSGRLCKSTATEAGLSKKFLHSFLDGFPPNWEDLLNSALKKLSLRKPHVQKVLQEAKSLSDSVEDNRGSCELVKKVKSAAALNNTNVAKILINKGSKNDPLTLQDLPVTRRSGRLVFPPLAWWANQRVMVDPASKATIIAQENENRLDLPAVHFKSSYEISPEKAKEEPVEIRKKDSEMKEQKATKDKKQLVETSSKRQRGRPRKSSDVVMKEIEIESSSSTDVVKDGQGIRSEGGQLKDGSGSGDRVIASELQTSIRRRKNQSGEISVPGFHDSRGSYRKQEKLLEASRSCSTSSVDTVCYSAQKRQRLNLKNNGDYQPDGFSSADCSQRSQVPQKTSPQTDSRKSLTINGKRSTKSDLTEETSGSSRSRKSCNVKSDRNEIKVPVRHGVKLNRTLTLQDSKVIQTFEKQKEQNSKHHCQEKLLNRKENESMDHESEGKKKTWSSSVVPPDHKTILRNENTGEKGGQKKLRQRRSSKVHSPSHKYKDTCSKLSSVQQKSRLNSDSEESWPATEESAQKRTKKHSRKELRSAESVELVYTKPDHLQKMVVMRHDSKKRRECATKDEFSFLTKSSMPMQGLPPKPRPSQFHACGNLSDQCDSDDSANVEYFFSSDESET